MKTEAVLFDIGGVLVELTGVAEFGAMIGQSGREAILQRWMDCPWVQRYESGECETAEFAHGVIEHFALEITPERFLTHFGGWTNRMLPGADALLRGLTGEVTIACLSNTNHTHWTSMRAAFSLHEYFDTYFLSFEIGAVKPDPAIFAHVCNALPCAPGAALFFDDIRGNVDAARAAGLDAHHVSGPGEARAILAGRGLLKT